MLHTLSSYRPLSLLLSSLVAFSLSCDSNPSSPPSTQHAQTSAPQQSHIPTAPDASPQATPDTPPPHPPTPNSPPPKRFLLIGDSQVQGAFGRALDYLLRRGVKDSEVTTHAVCASTPLSWTTGQKHLCGWMKRGPDFTVDEKHYGADPGGVVVKKSSNTPLLLESLLKHKPELLIMGLGENAKMAGMAYIRDAVSAMMRHITCYRAGLATVDACLSATSTPLPTPNVRALECVWVLPPWTSTEQSQRGLQRLLDTYTASIGDVCQIVDSRPLTCRAGHLGRTKICRPDRFGVHLGGRRARLWAFGAFAAILDMYGLAPMPDAQREALIKAWRLGL